MLFKEAVSKRIYELCKLNDITPNGLAEASSIPPSTLQGIMQCKVGNPSSYVIYQICKPLKISMKEFFDSDLFNESNLQD
ncbi:MAG: helix-turn-helix domain-containing protein [Bacilli bacterium]